MIIFFNDIGLNRITIYCRGAGDILGSEQAGFIDTVGIDLYLKLLNDEVEKLKGNPIKEEEIQNEKFFEFFQFANILPFSQTILRTYK